MSKKHKEKAPAEAPKTITEKISEAVDKLIHPDHADSEKAAAEKSQAEKDAEETHASDSEKPAEETQSAGAPAGDMSKHKKFDKFNGGIS